jgi:hypothetical protein
MGVSYANVPLDDDNSDALRNLLRRELDPARIWGWAIDTPGFAGSRPPSGVLPPEPLCLNRLVWPRDAARWASAHFVVSSSQLDAIRQQVYVSGNYTAQVLQFDDDAHDPVAPSMWLLPARPLYQIPNRTGAWLLSLVDDRFWWWRRAAVIVPSTWAQLYADIGAALGVVITADTVPAAYLTPTNDFAASYEYLPPLLDAVAQAVGQKIVRDYDGKVYAMSVATARTRLLANVDAGYVPLAGGQMAIGWY